MKTTSLSNGIIIIHKKELIPNGTSFTKPFYGKIILQNGQIIKKRNITIQWQHIVFTT